MAGGYAWAARARRAAAGMSYRQCDNTARRDDLASLVCVVPIVRRSGLSSSLHLMAASAETDALEATSDRAVERAALLAKVDLFSGLDRIALAKLAANLDPVEFTDRQPACTQGEPGDSLYIVSSGTLGVFVTAAATAGAGGDGRAGQHETRVALLTAGACFGEMALLTGEPRSATVRAIGTAEALRLERGRFIDVLRREPTIGLSISATLSRRLGKANRDILLVEESLAEHIRRGLDALGADWRARVLQAGVLETMTPRTLEALFGPDAQAVAHTLVDLGVETERGQTTATGRRVLRERLEESLGHDGLSAFTREAAARLEAAGCWDDALALTERLADREALLARLERAVHAASVASAHAPEEIAAGSPATGVRRWIERLRDEEVISRHSLALARAGWLEAQGASRAAVSLLRGALAALPAGHEAGTLLATEIARLSEQEGQAVQRAGASPAERLRGIWRAQRARPAAAGATLATVGFVAAAAMVSHTSPAWAFILLLCAAIALWVTAILPDFAVSLGLLTAWVLLGIAKPAQALAGYGTTSWMSALAILGLASAISTSGLLFRFGLLLVRRMPSGLFGQAATFLGTGIMLTPLLPSSTARGGLTLPLALTAAQAQRLEERSAESAFLGMAAYIGSNPMLFMFLNGSTSCLLALGLLPEATRARFDFTFWFIAALPLALVVGAGSLLMLLLVLRPGKVAAISHSRLNTQLTILGKVTKREIAMTVILLATVVGWNVGPALGLSSSAVGLISLLAAVLVGAFNKQSLQSLNWDFLVAYGVVLAISPLTVQLGVDKMAAQAVKGIIGDGGVNPLLFVMVVAVLNLIVRILLPQDQALLLLALALVPTAPVLGIDPWIIAITLLATFSTWFFPSQTIGYLVAAEAAEHRLFTNQQAVRACAGFTAVTLVGLAVSVPYWHWLGLL